MAEQIVVLDEQKMIERIHDLPVQFEKAWTSLWTKKIVLETDKVDRILVAGMGGSGVAGYLLKELLLDSPISVDVWQDYGLPAWVNEKTLVIGLSYSGDTEETVSAVEAALEKKALLAVITKGGKLEELATKHQFPCVKVDYTSSPREALGWLYGSLLTFLAKFNLIKISETTYFNAVKELKETVKEHDFARKAEDLVLNLNNKFVLVLTQSPLTAVAKRYITQINENSKTTALSSVMPELCHNTIVGLDFPIPEKIFVLYLESSYAFSRNKMRADIIKKLFEKKDIPFVPLSVRSKSLLAEQWLLIYFGDLLSYYLAGVYGVDPSPIEAINFLKSELKKV